MKIFEKSRTDPVQLGKPIAVGLTIYKEIRADFPAGHTVRCQMENKLSESGDSCDWMRSVTDWIQRDFFPTAVSLYFGGDIEWS